MGDGCVAFDGHSGCIGDILRMTISLYKKRRAQRESAEKTSKIRPNTIRKWG